MSTYNSKFSGAEIDALLEKVASGQVGGGGGGSSEKEDLAKEIGATHKHTITFSMEDGAIKIRGITYTNSADPLTVNRIVQLLAFVEGAYIEGHMAMSANGIVAVSNVTWCIGEGGELVVIANRLAFNHSYIESVDFTASTATTSTVRLLKYGEPLPVGMMVENSGGTFTDDVTEL